MSIDKSHYTLTCPTCKISETHTLFDQGSQWSSSDWDGPVSYSKFDTTWKGAGGRSEPDLLTATCKTCGTDATVDQRYMG